MRCCLGISLLLAAPIACFSEPPSVTSEESVRLRFEYECVHPTDGACSVEAFQFLVYSPDAEEPTSIPFDQWVTSGLSASVDVQVELSGPGDELVIALFSEAASPGQAIELVEPRLVREGP